MNERSTMRPPLYSLGRLRRLGLLALPLGLLLAIFSVVIVESGQVGLVVRAGGDAPSRVIAAPGIYLRLPFVDRVWLVDTRWQTSEQTALQPYTTSDQQPLEISAWAVWRVSDPLRFNIIADAGRSRVADHLEGALNKSLAPIVAGLPASQLFRGLPEPEHRRWLIEFNKLLQPMGMEVAQVGVRQIGFPDTLTKKVFQNMAVESQQGSQVLIQGLTSDEQQLAVLQSRQRDAVLEKAYRQAQQVRQAAENRLVETYAVQLGQPAKFRSLLQAPLQSPSAPKNNESVANKAD